MSARARRAQQRAEAPPPANPNPVPPQVAQRRRNIELSNIEKYDNEDEFIYMLRRIGINQAGIEQLSSDDFDTMKVLVDQYKDDVTEFSSYLKTINKSNSPVRFSPVISNRIIAVLHYFIQAVTCFHTVPDLATIDRDEATALVDPYNAYIKFKDLDADDDVIIDLPVLKGHENWIQYRDKFMSNLTNMIGSNRTPLAYIIDDNERTVTSRNNPFIETPTINIESTETYKAEMIHFGAHFRRDNSKV